MSPFLNRKTLHHGTFDKNLIYPHHAWIPSAENLIEDEFGFTLLDTGTAENKHHLIGYNGAGAPESRITIAVEADAPGGGSSVPAIQYNHSRFFRGEITAEDIQPNDYIEVLFQSASGVYNYNFATGGDAATPGWKSQINNIASSASIRLGSYSRYDSGRSISLPVFWGCLFYSSTYAKLRQSNITSSFYCPTRYSGYPVTIGGMSGESGSGTSGVRLSDRPVGPLLIYKNIVSESMDNFLMRRYLRVCDGNWQPYITREELRP